jgi:hypothetical protein
MTPAVEASKGINGFAPHVVRRLWPSDALNRSFSESAGILREFLLYGVGGERAEHRSVARQDPE